MAVSGTADVFPEPSRHSTFAALGAFVVKVHVAPVSSVLMSGSDSTPAHSERAPAWSFTTRPVVSSGCANVAGSCMDHWIGPQPPSASVSHDTSP